MYNRPFFSCMLSYLATCWASADSYVCRTHAITLLCTSALFHPNVTPPITTGTTGRLERPPPASILSVEGPRRRPLRLEQAPVLA